MLLSPCPFALELERELTPLLPIPAESRQKYAVGVVANYLPAKLAQNLLASYSYVRLLLLSALSLLAKLTYTLARSFPALSAYLSSTATSSVLGSTYLPGRAAAKLEAALAGGDSGFGAAAKKRKAAESKGSRGVEALKKVNTKGMASLKDMFGRQAATKKPEAKKEVDEGGPAKKKRKA